MIPIPRRTCAIAALALGLALAALCVARAQPAGKQTVPPPTTEGEFTGTWFRREPGLRQALQLRKQNGQYQMRYYVWTEQQLVLDTSWQERLEYVYRGQPGVIEIVVDQEASTDNEIVARFTRRQRGSQDADRSEEGQVRLFRAGTGRALVWRQDKLVSRVVVPEPIAPYQEDGQATERQRVWIFDKAARRLIEWDEVPW